jgi:hypothetical protein
MKGTKVLWTLALGVLWIGIVATPALAAYSSHQNDQDINDFLAVYPFTRSSKLNDCSLCHPGGKITQNGKTSTYGSCDYCHITYGIQPPYGQIPLNAYGTDYKSGGRSQLALHAIEAVDSDGDGYNNLDEIHALTFPGDKNDLPGLLPATMVVLTQKDIQKLPRHKQFLLYNAQKSQDFYATYEGTTIADLLEKVNVQPGATQITVFAPDGFSKTFPIEAPDPQIPPNFQYDVLGPYPQGIYYAGLDFVEYPKRPVYHTGSTIPGDLYMILAYKRDGALLTPGILEPDPNTPGRLVLNGEGPFRLVNPQKGAGAPDRPSTATSPVGDGFDYDSKKDHNAGSSVRSVTAIRVEPLPPGTTDFAWAEGGWNLVDQKKIVIYGAIDPVTYPITGQILDKKRNPIAHVLVTFGLGSMGQAGSSISGSDGNFEQNLPAGTYTITPSKAGYTFTPASMDINLLPPKKGVKIQFKAYPAP